MTATEIRRHVLVGGALALAATYVRLRARTLTALLTHPLAIIALLIAGSFSVQVLSTRGDAAVEHPGAAAARIAGFVLGLVLLVVMLTAQRGSPLRLQPADVSWVLQSASGPRIVLLVHSIGSAPIAFLGTTAASATALLLRGEPVLWAALSGCSMGGVLLLVRTTSLMSHLLGRSLRSSRRRYALVGVLAAGAAWIGAFAQSLLGGVDTIGSTAMAIAALPFEVVLAPATSGPAHATAVLAISVLSSVAVGVLVRRADAFVEPAVEESILARQLARALSGDGRSGLSGRGFAGGVPSWTRWPESAVGAVLASHLAQTRRRRLQDPGTAIALLALAALSVLLRETVPMPLTAILIVVILALPGPSQPIGEDLDHQHLPLADVSIGRVGFAGMALHALVSLAVALPAVVLWASVHFWSIGHGLLAVVPLALCCASAALAGIGSRTLSGVLLGRVVATVLLTLLPVVSAVVIAALYEGGDDAPRTLLTLTGALLITCLLYSGLAWAALQSTRPASRVGGGTRA